MRWLIDGKKTAIIFNQSGLLLERLNSIFFSHRHPIGVMFY